MYLFLIFVIYYYLETTLDVGTHNKKGECKMDISTIKEEIASLEAKEKEIIEFLEKNADQNHCNSRIQFQVWKPTLCCFWSCYGP